MIRHSDMLFTDFPPIGKTTLSVKNANAERTFTESVRINNGQYPTDEQAEEYRECSLKRVYRNIILIF